MPPQLVLCRCDETWPAFAVCEACEKRWLEERLASRRMLRPDHPAQRAYDELLASLDADDRARDLADDHRLVRR